MFAWLSVLLFRNMLRNKRSKLMSIIIDNPKDMSFGLSMVYNILLVVMTTFKNFYFSIRFSISANKLKKHV